MQAARRQPLGGGGQSRSAGRAGPLRAARPGLRGRGGRPEQLASQAIACFLCFTREDSLFGFVWQPRPRPHDPFARLCGDASAVGNLLLQHATELKAEHTVDDPRSLSLLPRRDNPLEDFWKFQNILKVHSRS